MQARAAAGHSAIQTYSSGFRVVGCTAAVDARDNTATTYTSADKGVPIYWLNGTKVADQYEDFYDGSWDDQVNAKDESGNDRVSPLAISYLPDAATTAQKGCLLLLAWRSGVARCRIGETGRHHTIGSAAIAASNLDHPFYGLSQVFQVPTPPPRRPRTTRR